MTELDKQLHEAAFEHRHGVRALSCWLVAVITVGTLAAALIFVVPNL